MIIQLFKIQFTRIDICDCVQQKGPLGQLGVIPEKESGHPRKRNKRLRSSLRIKESVLQQFVNHNSKNPF